MFNVLLLVGFIIIWMVIGSVVSISRGTDTHEKFGLFMFESVGWPLVLYVVGWTECASRVSKWFLTHRGN